MKELLKTIAVSILTLASTIACSQENIRASNDTKRGAVANLCDADEESIFTCFTEKKIASLCLRQQEGNVYIKYRYGSPEKIELIYPISQADSSEGFKLSTTPYPGGGENRIRFAIAEYNYYLYDIAKSESDDQGQYPVFKSGILALKNNATILSKSCKNDASIKAPAFEVLQEENFNYNLDMIRE
ncbi:hypothetical protein [Stutzerimonas chloritidismutans]|uniref:Lipoprotein n=1 Tax=Stutzerimonas chloritidismutans TaxID=203192 RepID=A0ABU9MEW9_STUCH